MGVYIQSFFALQRQCQPLLGPYGRQKEQSGDGETFANFALVLQVRRSRSKPAFARAFEKSQKIVAIPSVIAFFPRESSTYNVHCILFKIDFELMNICNIRKSEEQIVYEIIFATHLLQVKF